MHSNPIRRLAGRPLRLAVALTAAAAGLALAAPAHASSIAYVKDGDVYLTSPDGATGYRVTFDGGYSSPSQADDGTIVAIRHAELVRLDRGGRPIGQPVPAMGSTQTPGGDTFYGPYDARVSPDGTRIAYWFGQYTQYYSSSCGCWLWHVESYSAWSYNDHFTDPSEVGYAIGSQKPSWLDGNHLLIGVSGLPDAASWQLGGNAGDGWSQFWFQYVDEGVNEAVRTRDTKRVAAIGGWDTDGQGGDVVLTYTTNGPAWTDDGPPWDPYDPFRPKPAEPTLHCELRGDGNQRYRGISWSPQGDAFTVVQQDGVHLYRLPTDSDACGAITNTLLVPGGTDAGWGPADVNRGQAPAAPAPTAPPAQPAPPAPSPPPAAPTPPVQPSTADHAAPRLALQGVRRGVLRLTLSEPARLTLRIQRQTSHGYRAVATRTLAGKPGSNGLRLPKLRVGRYRLTLVARDPAGNQSTARAGLRVG